MDDFCVAAAAKGPLVSNSQATQTDNIASNSLLVDNMIVHQVLI